MTVDVVKILEVVDVEHKETELVARLSAIGNLPVQLLSEIPVIVERSQTVGDGVLIGSGVLNTDGGQLSQRHQHLQIA